jgi:hypothetical protein
MLTVTQGSATVEMLFAEIHRWSKFSKRQYAYLVAESHDNGAKIAQALIDILHARLITKFERRHAEAEDKRLFLENFEKYRQCKQMFEKYDNIHLTTARIDARNTWVSLSLSPET